MIPNREQATEWFENLVEIYRKYHRDKGLLLNPDFETFVERTREFIRQPRRK